MSYVIAILVFSVMILIHELGHFITAKLCGIAVVQFTIGFGPALVKWKRKGTLYAIRLLPIGGAVMMKGEEDEASEKLLTAEKNLSDDAPGIAFPDAKIWKRFIIVVAGALMNFISGVLIVMILLIPSTHYNSTYIGGFMEGFRYNTPTGFQEGDRLVRVNDFHIYTLSDLNAALMLGEGEPYSVVVERDGKKISLGKIPMKADIYSEEDKSYKFGFMLEKREVNGFGKLKLAADTSLSYVQSAVAGLRMLVRGQVGTEDMIGTVGIANEIGTLARTDFRSMWSFVAFISVNLAVVNLLPIPVLDGGKVLFLLFELIARKKLDPKYEGYASLVGLVLILALFVFVTYHDIVRLIGG